MLVFQSVLQIARRPQVLWCLALGRKYILFGLHGNRRGSQKSKEYKKYAAQEPAASQVRSMGKAMVSGRNFQHHNSDTSCFTISTMVTYPKQQPSSGFYEPGDLAEAEGLREPIGRGHGGGHGQDQSQG